MTDISMEYGTDRGQATYESAYDVHWAVVGKLTPGLIHEINNTLCAVGNYVQLLTLQGERQGWDILRPLAAMSSSLERAQAMTHRVAGYVRGPACPGSRLRLNDLLEEALALASLQRTFREIRIQKRFADDLPEIEGDPKPLMDALVELLGIAAHAVGRGGALTVVTRSTPGWVMAGFGGSGRWRQGADENLALARRIVEHQGGRVTEAMRSGSTDEQIAVWFRTGGSREEDGCPAA